MGSFQCIIEIAKHRMDYKFMFKPLPLYIGSRYMRTKKKNFFVSFISLSSMLAIGMGVMVLITVLSVMNGFHDKIYKNFFGMVPEITIHGKNGSIDSWQQLSSQLKNIPGIKAMAPFAGGQVLLSADGRSLPAILSGISPVYEQYVNHLKDKLLLGDVNDLNHFGIILGRVLAEKLGVTLNEQVTVMLPEAGVTPTGMVPRFKRFTVVGIFSAGSGFGFDGSLAFVNLEDAQKLMHLGTAVSGLKMKIDSIYQAPALAAKIDNFLGNEYIVGDWTQQFGAFFQAVKMEKTMMFFVLLLIIAVAAFSLVSSLVMIVNDKQAEIAILRTIGATPKTILLIFITQGMLVGFVGTVLGLLGGLFLAVNAPTIVNFLQAMLNMQLFSFGLYGDDYLASKIMTSDLIKICAAALIMSFIATIYPAWRAARTVIAEALHYE